MTNKEHSLMAAVVQCLFNAKEADIHGKIVNSFKDDFKSEDANILFKEVAHISYKYNFIDSSILSKEIETADNLQLKDTLIWVSKFI